MRTTEKTRNNRLKKRTALLLILLLCALVVSAHAVTVQTAAGEYADWNDGMFESVQVANVTNRQHLFEGTDWDWDNYDNLVNGYSLSESIAESTYWEENYIVYEITFQGGAHDSMISLYFNDDNSSLSYAIDNDYYEVLTALKDNAARKSQTRP